MDRLTFEEPRMPAVFLLSAPRSGSTLLRYILDTHSRIASPGEILLARLCFDLDLVLSRTLGVGLPPTRATADRLAAETRRVVSGLMEAYARGKGKDVWCDKSPRNLEYLASLRKTFPDARYVCLYRNGPDTVRSMLNASQQGFMLELAPYAARNPNNLVAAMIDAWCDYSGKMLDLEAELPERTFRIRYEDVVLRSEATLRPLFEFLGVGWEPQVLEKALATEHDEGGGDLNIKFTRAIQRAGIGKGSSLPFFRIEPALAQLNAMLARLDYPEVAADWNERPSPYLPPAAAGATGESAGAAPAEAGGTVAAVPAGGDGGSAPAEVTDLRDYFLARLPASLRLRAAEAAKANASVKFVLEGDALGPFWVDLRREPRVVAEDRPADCTLTVSTEALLDIVNRRLNPVSAFSQSRIKIQGALPLAYHMMRFVTL